MIAPPSSKRAYSTWDLRQARGRIVISVVVGALTVLALGAFPPSLRAVRDSKGKPLKIITLPMPRPVIFEGQRLPASYANFYVANSVVIVPTFNDPADREAIKTLASVFTDREVVGIHSLDLVWGLGTLHCLTREEPAVDSPDIS